MQSAKQVATTIINHLPEQASWEDIMYELYAKQKIEEGLADIEAGCIISHAQIKAKSVENG